jgi:hypothetical protein
MCQLVTIGVPKSSGSAAPTFGGPRDPLAVAPSQNPHVAAIFPATDLRFQVTIGGCSCGLVGRNHGAGEDGSSRQRLRYERMGWSRAKIERALQASTTARGRDRTYDPARRFRDGVLALLDRVPSLRLFVHTYRGDFDTEVVVSTGVTHLSRVEYEAANGAFPEDTLVEVAG